MRPARGNRGLAPDFEVRAAPDGSNPRTPSQWPYATRSAPTTPGTPAANSSGSPPHGRAALGRSAAVFDELRAEWAEALGADRVRDIETALRTVVPTETAFRLDATSWLCGA